MEVMSPTIGALAAALAKAQAELQPAKESADNPFFKSKYADLKSCWEAVRNVLPKYGLAISQSIAPSDNNKISVISILLHDSGEWITSNCTLTVEARSGTNMAQAAGSAITYARRYGLAAIIGLATDDDDDANSAGNPYQPENKKPPRSSKSNGKAPSSAPAPKEPAPDTSASSEHKLQITMEQFRQMRKRMHDRGADATPEDCQKEWEKVLHKDIRSFYDITFDDYQTYMTETSEPEELPD